MSSILERLYFCVDEDGVAMCCLDHPKWQRGVDGMSLATVLDLGRYHLHQEHRVHVLDCMCRDRVIDGRCIPAGVRG